MEFFHRLYARRVVNVNLNVFVAGVLAMLLTLIPVHLTRYFGVVDKHVIMAVTYGFDIFFDLGLYFGLHWAANHWPKAPWFKHKTTPHTPFWRDAGIVQIQRIVLGPLYYGVAVLVQWYLFRVYGGEEGNHRELITMVALLTGLTATRIVHTLWMLWDERRAARRMALLREDIQSQAAPVPGPIIDPARAAPRSGS